MKKIFTKPNITAFFTFLGLYLLSAGVSFALFTTVIKAPRAVVTGEEEIGDIRKGDYLVDVSGPKDQVCPINNFLYSKGEKNAWDNKRPLLVMIENHKEARPQSGISKADVVYEAVAEGGITRFLAVFYCDAQAQDIMIGPVRSARTYFLDFASEYGKYPLYAHVGGANTPGPANALGQIQDYGWGGSEGNDLNQFSIGYPTFRRDYERLGHTVATEHTMYSTTEGLWDVAKSRNWTNVSPKGQNWLDNFEEWKFGKEADEASSGDINKIEVNFWEGYNDHQVIWNYDKAKNSYLRNNGGQTHNDLNYDEQISVKNVIVQFMTEQSANDGYKNNLHLLYGTTGKGKTLVFNNGEVVTGTWEKESRTDRTKFYGASGKETPLVPGKIWIEIVPKGSEVDY